VTQHTLSSPPPVLALRPLTGIVGRGGEMGRLFGHLDAGRSVRLEAPRGAGATALLRALCGEPPRPTTPDGTIALPVGIPVDDAAAVVARAQSATDADLAERRMLVLLDDRDATHADIAALGEVFSSSLLVVTGDPDAGGPDMARVSVRGLSQHHAVGLVEAAMGRALTLDEGRGARAVATAVAGMPGALVQAAAAVRDGGLTFADVLDLLDDPPRPAALSAALQGALDDSLHATLSHVRAVGDVPVPTRIAAVAAGLDRDEAQRRLRRLALLGLVLTDGRDGWTVAAGVPPVSEPVRASVAERLTAWLSESPTDLDIVEAAPVLAVVADRMQADDPAGTKALTTAARATLPLDGIPATTALLERAATWSAPARTEHRQASAPPAAEDAETPGGAAVAGLEEPAAWLDDEVVDTGAPQAGASGADLGDGGTGEAEPSAGGDAPSALVRDAAPAGPSAQPGPAQDDSLSRHPVLAFASDRRRLALVAVVAAAVIAAILLVVPSLRQDDTPAVLRGDVDLGVASVGESTSGTLAFDLTSSDASAPLDLTVSGPDADAFTIDPARCDSLDCRAAVTFTPDRSGTHLAAVTAVDATGAARAEADLTASGTGDAPAAPLQTNLSVTLFPTEPTPIPAGGDATLPVGVTNGGPDDSSGAVLVLSVPDQVTAAAEGCTFAGTDLRCPLAELPAGQNERLAVTLTVADGVESVRVTGQVDPVTDVDEATGDNAAGFTYPVAPPADEG